MTQRSFRSGFLLILVGATSAVFLAMLRPFLITILLAAVFSGVGYPTYLRIVQSLRGRTSIAAVITLVLIVFLVVGPLFAVLFAAGNEAVRISQTIGPKLKEILSGQGGVQGGVEGRLQSLPGYSMIEPFRDQLLARIGDLVSATGTLLFEAISATTVAGVLLLFQFAVMLYTMYFFLVDGPELLKSGVSYLPLTDEEKERMFDRFVSVTRATLKGTVVVGMAQGLLSGIAFWVVGIDGAVFWGVVITVLSIIPAVGGGLVWIPAAIVMAFQGRILAAIALAAWCALVVGSVDNVLRPRLVGRDTQMHELLIFFSTLGGLWFFGATGFIVGPILAALFLTVWEMVGVAFRLAAPRRSPPAA